ncbi:MAG: hypothetical protein WCA36_04015 [Pseudolabrys sp.]
MAKARVRLCLAILGGVLALGGCSPSPMMERMPAVIGGLPSGAPAAPVTPYRYPAVHDTPPPRAAAPLSDQQQLELEKQLQKARKKQEGEAAGMEKRPLGSGEDSK